MHSEDDVGPEYVVSASSLSVPSVGSKADKGGSFDSGLGIFDEILAGRLAVFVIWDDTTLREETGYVHDVSSTKLVGDSKCRALVQGDATCGICYQNVGNYGGF